MAAVALVIRWKVRWALFHQMKSGDLVLEACPLELAVRPRWRQVLTTAPMSVGEAPAWGRERGAL